MAYFIGAQSVLPDEPHDLPIHLADLLERYADMLLKYWKVDQAFRADPDLSVDAGALGIREKKHILRQVARHIKTMSGATANLISVDVLETIVAKAIKDKVQSNHFSVSRAIIWHLRERNGILCKAGGEQYGFVHRAFLDYFYADDLREQLIRGEIDKTYLELLFEEHWRDEDWQEVLYLFCAKVKPQFAGAVLMHLLKPYKSSDFTFLFIANCLKWVKDRGEIGALLQSIKESLLLISKHNPPESSPFPEYAAGTTREQEEYCNDRLRDAWQIKYMERDEAASKAVTLLGALFGGENDLVDHLLKLADSSEYSSVQMAVVETMAQYWKNNPITLEWLKKCAQHANAFCVREASLKSLSRHWNNNSSVLEFLKSRSLSDKVWMVRATAIEEIASVWKNDKVVLAWLKRQCVDEEHPFIRDQTIEGIAQNYHIDKPLRAWLKTARNREKRRLAAAKNYRNVTYESTIPIVGEIKGATSSRYE